MDSVLILHQRKILIAKRLTPLNEPNKKKKPQSVWFLSLEAAPILKYKSFNSCIAVLGV